MTDHPWLSSYPENIDWFAQIPSCPLYAILDDAVQRFADNTAIDFLGKTYSYRELGALVNRAARGLRKHGVKNGVRVGLFLPNCPQFIIAYYAILKAGGVVVNYSPLSAQEDIAKQIEDSATDIMITLNLEALHSTLYPLLKKTRLQHIIVGTMQEVLPFPKNLLFGIVKYMDIAGIPKDGKHIKWRDILDAETGFLPDKIDPIDTTAVLQYTGGTTGTPKGAVLSHHNLYANTLQCALWFTGLKEGEERMMGVLPFFHVFAMTVVMNLAIKVGAAIIMHPRFELEKVLKDIQKKKPTLMPGVPTMFVAINNHPDIEKYDLSSIKACLCGGAPLPLEVKQTFEKLSGCSLVEGYGLTETSPVACCNPLFGKNKAGSIGIPLPQTVIEIESLETPGTFLPVGEKGQICVTGPQVMCEYLNKKEENEQTFIGGRLRTGDIGHMDEEGYIFISDRLKEMIIAGGFNIYPRHVEEAFYAHDAVQEAAVVGIPDEYRGQTVKAFVVLKPGRQNVTEQSLKAFVGSKVAKYEVPEYIEFRKTLPKTMIGKISKKDLLQEEEKNKEKPSDEI